MSTKQQQIGNDTNKSNDYAFEWTKLKFLQWTMLSKDAFWGKKYYYKSVTIAPEYSRVLPEIMPSYLFNEDLRFRWEWNLFHLQVCELFAHIMIAGVGKRIQSWIQYQIENLYTYTHGMQLKLTLKKRNSRDVDRIWNSLAFLQGLNLVFIIGLVLVLIAQSVLETKLIILFVNINYEKSLFLLQRIS